MSARTYFAVRPDISLHAGTIWHHINDVKRNPELADIADNVIPSRGGTSGHVDKYHPNGIQAGSSGGLLNRDSLRNEHIGEQ